MTCKRKEDIYFLKLLDQNKVTTGLSFIHACKKKNLYTEGCIHWKNVWISRMCGPPRTLSANNR